MLGGNQRYAGSLVPPLTGIHDKFPPFPFSFSPPSPFPEFPASLFMTLERYSEAGLIYRELLMRNPENYMYHERLVECLGLKTEAAKLAHYKELAVEFPRSHVIRKMPLLLTSGVHEAVLVGFLFPSPLASLSSLSLSLSWQLSFSPLSLSPCFLLPSSTCLFPSWLLFSLPFPLPSLFLVLTFLLPSPPSLPSSTLCFPVLASHLLPLSPPFLFSAYGSV